MADDKPVVDVEDETNVDLNASDDKPTGGDDSEAVAAAAAKEAAEAGPDLATILKDAGLDPEDPESVKMAISEMSNISKQAGSTENLEALLATAKEMEDHKVAWALEAELKKRGEETPEATIARLDEEKQALRDEYSAKEDKQKRSKEAQDSVKFFDTTSGKAIDSAKDVPDYMKPVLKKLISSQNQITQVDLNDTAAAQKLVADQGKMLGDMVAKAIQLYADGKIEIPVVGKSVASTPSKKTFKNLKESESGVMDYIKNHLPGLAKSLK